MSKLNFSTIPTAAPGYTVLLTGAASGIGRAVAFQLAATSPATLILISRDKAGLESLKSEIAAAHPDVRVDMYAIDLVDPKQADTLADAVRDGIAAGTYAPIDCLFLNAGAVFPKNTTTPAGIDTMAHLHALHPYMFVQRLLADRSLRGCHPPSGRTRIVYTGSDVHKFASATLVNTPKETWLAYPQYAMSNMMTYYGKSKLLGHAGLEELARRVRAGKIDADLVLVHWHPGAVNTNVIRSAGNSFLKAFVGGLLAIIFLTPDQAAKPGVYLAVTEDLKRWEKGHSVYYAEAKQTALAPEAADEKFGEQVWQVLEEAAANVKATGKAF